MTNAQLNLNNLAGCSILVRVLSILSYEEQEFRADLAGYRKVAELATVCKTWKAVLKPFLYRRAIVDAEYPGSKIGGANAYLRTWRSNIPAIIAADMTSYTKELHVLGVVDSASHTPMNILQHIGLDGGLWTNLKSFCCSASHVNVNEYAPEDITPIIHKNVCYLASRLPSLTCADILFNINGGTLCRISQLLNQVMCHNLTWISLNLAAQPSFAANLPVTLRELVINGGAVPTNIRFQPMLAANLTRLVVRLASSGFPWCIFASSCSDTVQFASLEELHMSFLSGTETPPFVKFKPELDFPSLKRLTIQGVASASTGLYDSVADSPLRHVKISESARHAAAVNPLVVSKIDQFHLNIFSEIFLNVFVDGDYEGLIRKLLGTRSPLRIAELRLTLLDFPHVETVLWDNLQNLSIVAEAIELARVCRLLPQLPRLRVLGIECDRLLATESLGGLQVRVLSSTIESLTILPVTALDRNSRARLQWVVSKLPSLLKLIIRHDAAASFLGVSTSDGGVLEIFVREPLILTVDLGRL